MRKDELIKFDKLVDLISHFHLAYQLGEDARSLLSSILTGIEVFDAKVDFSFLDMHVVKDANHHSAFMGLLKNLVDILCAQSKCKFFIIREAKVMSLDTHHVYISIYSNED